MSYFPKMARRVWPLLAVLAWWSRPVAGLTPHEEARALLDRWLETQNTGRFDEYQSYYRDEFTGVRRSGNRTARFDRAGWLQDRKRMFAKPMKVEADNVHIFASARSARVVFTQRWSSGRYADSGTKQLILRHGADGFHITREELFASDTRKPGTIDLEAFHRFAFVVDDEVVLTMQPDDSWAVGPTILEKRGKDPDLDRSRREVDATKLPPGVAALVGAPVRLLDARGQRCQAKLGKLLLRGREYMGSGEPDDDGSNQAPSERALNAVWEGSAHYLVARVVGDPKACAGATWARSAALPVPAIVAAERPPADLKDRALAALEALPESATIQREFARWYAGEHPKSRRPPPVWFRLTEHRPLIRMFRPASGPVLLSVSAMAAEGGCGDGIFNALWALWEVDDKDPAHPRLILRNQPDTAFSLQPTAAVDVDGDGRLELLFDSSSDYATVNAAGQPDYLEHGIARALDGSYVQIEGPETPMYICPC
jgi:hypothetical protein